MEPCDRQSRGIVSWTVWIKFVSHPSGTTQRVLHVVDRTEGGVPVAAATYIRNSPSSVEHHVLAPFTNGHPPEVWVDVPATLHDLGSGVTSRIMKVARTAHRVQATVVHAHSSFAGAYARVAPIGRHARLVYTPHCFSFTRTDGGATSRLLYRGIESLLASRTDLLAACSPGEMAIAQGFRLLRGRASLIPNVASIDSADPLQDMTSIKQQVRVGMLGRVSPQKDPRKFLGILDAMRSRGIGVDAYWIGDGDEQRADLGAANVQVTGWLAADDVLLTLRSLDVYIHSAAWEGFPIAVLDAHAAGLPILVRPIPAFGKLPEELTTNNVGLDALSDALSSPTAFSTWRRANREAWNDLLERNSPAHQRAALAEAWGVPCELV